MARTANTGFYFRKDLRSNTSSPEPLLIRMGNSATLRVGDLVRVNSAGFAVAAGTNPPAGVCSGLVDDNGINPFSLVYDTTVPNVTLTGQDTITTSSANQTNTHYMQAEVIMDPGGTLLFENVADGTIAQSNLFQFYNADANGRQVATGTSSNTSAQLQLIQLDPDNSGSTTKGLFRIVTGQLISMLGNATAVRVA